MEKVKHNFVNNKENKPSTVIHYHPDALTL